MTCKILNKVNIADMSNEITYMEVRHTLKHDKRQFSGRLEVKLERKLVVARCRSDHGAKYNTGFTDKIYYF